jgi:hypothetical protein
MFEFFGKERCVELNKRDRSQLINEKEGNVH